MILFSSSERRKRGFLRFRLPLEITYLDIGLSFFLPLKRHNIYFLSSNLFVVSKGFGAVNILIHCLP